MDINKFITLNEDVAELVVPVKKYFETDGLGNWSSVAKRVYVQSIKMTIGLVKDDNVDYYLGSSDLCVFFAKSSWNTSKLGLIYTDKTFKACLRRFLIDIGFDRAAVDDVHYSEQGMQGRLYVSCDAYDLQDWIRKQLMQT